MRTGLTNANTILTQSKTDSYFIVTFVRKIVQPKLFHIQTKDDNSYSIRNEEGPNFHTTWHYHTEIEITLILKSTGTRFVGDNIDTFLPGDLVIVGENLPHVWKNDDPYFEKGHSLISSAIVIQFSREFAGKNFFHLPELLAIENLLDKAKQGISFEGKMKKEISKDIKRLFDASPFSRFTGLLTILDKMSNTPNHKLIASRGFAQNLSNYTTHRINNVINYIMENFRYEISLAEAASVANLTPNAFCRYFKTVTRKTFSHYINDVRVGYACRLLQSGRDDITRACFSSGFNNLSYFNRQFKKVMGMSPSAYQKHHLKVN